MKLTIRTVATAVLLAAACSVEASTKVAVLEFGKGGPVVRRTKEASSAAAAAGTSVDGVASFWDALHRGRKLQQHPGMPVVPDLFRKAHVGIVLGLTGRKVGNLKEDLPAIGGLFEMGGDSSSVAMEMKGSHCKHLMSRVGNKDSDVESVEGVGALKAAVEKHAAMDGLSGISANIDGVDVRDVDEAVGYLMAVLQQSAEESGKNVVLHLVIEEEDDGEDDAMEEGEAAPAFNGGSMHRRLEDEQGQEENNNGEEGENGENNNNNNANGNNGQYSGYYGYGYYNAYGEWVTPYKTMFQIQYFNVVLWTSIGLALALFYVIYMMMFMPLEPDTLLFGESAKVVGEE